MLYLSINIVITLSKNLCSKLCTIFLYPKNVANEKVLLDITDLMKNKEWRMNNTEWKIKKITKANEMKRNMERVFLFLMGFKLF